MWFILRKKCTHFVANSVHFLSHVHSGKSVIQLCEQNKLPKISQLRVDYRDHNPRQWWTNPNESLHNVDSKDIISFKDDLEDDEDIAVLGQCLSLKSLLVPLPIQKMLPV